MLGQIKAEFEDYLKDHLTFKEEMKGDGPHSTLAYILLTDQFPRNMYRNDPRAFATDVFAREATFHALEQGWDKQLDPSSRMFLYLPLEHSENMEHQLKCLEKMAELERDDETGGSKGLVGFATEHSDLIKRFGRFPHRNSLLGRENTAEEAAFLEAKGGSMFGQGKKEEKKE